MIKNINTKKYISALNACKDLKILRKEQERINEKMDEAVKELKAKEFGVEKVAFLGHTLDAYIFIANLINSANNSIIIIDDNVSDGFLRLLSERRPGVNVTVYSSNVLNMDKPGFKTRKTPRCECKYIILDDKVGYYIGEKRKDSMIWPVVKVDDLECIRMLLGRLSDYQ